MAQTKTEKRNQAKKVAEMVSAKRKAERSSKVNGGSGSGNKEKGKSAVPQTKKK